MLKDTSYAILPSSFKSEQQTFHSVGSVLSVKWDGKILSGTLNQGTFFLYLLDENNIRFNINPFGNSIFETTLAVEKDEPLEGVEFFEDVNMAKLKYGDFHVSLTKENVSLTIKNKNEVLFKTLDPCVFYTKEKHVVLSFYKQKELPVYGLGEKSGFINKNGERISNWNTDVYAPHNKDTVELYQSIPFVIIHEPRKVSTGIFFDNSHKTIFDMQRYKDRMTICAEGGSVNVYIITGKDIKDTVKHYSNITGRMPLPPRWSLGYHQSRYSYSSQDEVKKIINKFKINNIPLDCIFLDIHHMNEFRVFTIDEDMFPQIDNLINELTEQGIDVVPIVDPGVKKDVHYDIYREGIENNYFSEYLDNDVYYGRVWPGLSAFPDFFQSEVQKWWGNHHSFYTKKGIRGIWNDMNEPSVFNETKTMDLDVMHNKDGEFISHKEGHNLYGLYMSKATFDGLKRLSPNIRPFSLTRAGYAGVQRYSAVWTGDNRSHWEHLEMSLPMIMNLGMSGIPFSGADVGGFSSDTTPELLIRWTQVGALMPYFRNHSVQDSIYQEPWVFGEETMNLVKYYIELRYKFLPYLYTLFYEAEMTGIPVVRPLIMEYPGDTETINCSDQFMVGSQLIVAPILRPGQNCRKVYLPEGVWYNWWTNEKLIGGKNYLVSAELNILPMFVKEGSVIPLGSKVVNTKEKQQIELVAFYSEDKEICGSIYEDDGISYNYREEDYCFTDVIVKKNGRVDINTTGSHKSNINFKNLKIKGKNSR